MKTNNQFTPLTEKEAIEINGGGLLGSVNNTVNTANSLGASLGTTVTTLGAGAELPVHYHIGTGPQ